jgi:hypothetical protein
MSLPKPKSVKPKLKSKKILVSVNLLNRDGGNATVQQNVSKIIAWYKQRMTTGGYFPDYVTNFKISHVAEDLFEFDYKTQDESFAYPEIIADPDDDGNHPIKIGKFTYLIAGRHIKTVGSVSKPKKAGAKKLLMYVSLSHPDREVRADAKKVIAWYKKQLDDKDYYALYLSYFKISHIDGNLFTVEYINDESGLTAEAIASPGANKPIKLGRTEHLVYGHVLRKF